MDKYIPEPEDILDRLYKETHDIQTVGDLDDFLKLELHDTYKANTNRPADRTYRLPKKGQDTQQ